MATEQCISIPIIDDSIDESEQECFTLSFSKSSDSANITVSPAVITICINDTDGELEVILLVYFCSITINFVLIMNVESALVVGFQQTAYTIDEVDGYQLVCIQVLSGDVDGREIMLDYSTSSGTACTLRQFFQE